MPPASAALSYPNLPCRFTALALLLREMLHNLGHLQADVLGISWGGGLGFATLPLLPLIRQRTLVLTGDQDPIIPVANGRILAAGIPHATLHVYHGGHIELVTRPSLLTPLITAVLVS